MKRSITIISISPIKRDARVLRQVNYLRQFFHVNVIGLGTGDDDWALQENCTFFPIAHTGAAIDHVTAGGSRRGLPRKLAMLRRVIAQKQLGQFTASKLTNMLHLTLLKLLGKFPAENKRAKIYDFVYWCQQYHRPAYQLACSLDCSLLLANDWNTLPIAVAVKQQRRVPILFDAHEYSPLEYEDDPRWLRETAPLVCHILRASLPAVDAMMTVEPTIAQRYHDEFGVEPVVVMSAPDYQEAVPAHAVDSREIHLIHHGGAMRMRCLELMIDTIGYADARYHLHFMLVGDDVRYIEELRNHGEASAPGRIHFEAQVLPQEIVGTIARYDIGFYLLKPTSFNNACAFPNKIFDFINAGLAICLGPSPAMSALVSEYRLGCIAPSFEPKEVAGRVEFAHHGANRSISCRGVCRGENAECRT